MSKPSQPVSKPSQPVTKPSQPVTKPSEPVTKPSQPVTKPSQPVTKPSQPVTKPSAPVSKPTKPVSQPTKNIGLSSVKKPTQAVAVKLPTQNVVKFNKPSYLSNPTTIQNLNVSKSRADGFRNNTRITTIINNNRTYITNYNVDVRARFGTINGWHNDGFYHNFYSAYWDHGFYGGYFYPVYPCYDISPYMYYSMVYWLWAPTYDNDYFTTWYGDQDYVSYPVNPFPYRDDYFPTETFRDLAIEMSALSSAQQGYFRTSMVNLTEGLAQQLADDMNVSLELNQNEVTINHYENLGNNAVVVEGSVDLDRDSEDIHVHAAFKALLDLTNPANTMVFVPLNGTPTAADLATLQAINNSIQALGGNPYQADVEPAVVAADNSLLE